MHHQLIVNPICTDQGFLAPQQHRSGAIFQGLIETSAEAAKKLQDRRKLNVTCLCYAQTAKSSNPWSRKGWEQRCNAEVRHVAARNRNHNKSSLSARGESHHGEACQAYNANEDLTMAVSNNRGWATFFTIFRRTQTEQLREGQLCRWCLSNSRPILSASARGGRSSEAEPRIGGKVPEPNEGQPNGI